MVKEKDLDELVSAGVLTTDTAESISAYYRSKRDASPNKLLIVFGILGAILVGLGIILIVAHNWDDFSTPLKSFFAFLPLVSGQLLCAYTLLKKYDQDAWREASAAFTFFAIGACISLVSQIYNIQGDIYEFMFTWMVLAAPLIYLMRSSIASLLFIAGITFYATTLGYFETGKSAPWYFALLLFTLPYYYVLVSRKPDGNFTKFHHWFVPISLTIALGTLSSSADDLLFVAYISMFGLFYGIGQTGWVSGEKIRFNSYKVLGSLGTIITLLILSFEWFWEHLSSEHESVQIDFSSPVIYVTVAITIFAAFLLYKNLKKRPSFGDIRPIEPIFLIFVLTFFIGYYSQISQIICNLLVFGVGLLTIREGARNDNLGVLNYGLMIIAALVICRFFDSELTFVIKGILFLLVGVGFFVANYMLIKKRKAHGE